jgi:hypothetical protein
MIIFSTIDVSGEATQASGEAHAALGRGDTERAAAFRKTAGDLLEAQAAKTRKPSDKHLIRFLAASQYYHGGHYQRAQELSRKIDARLLVGDTRALFKKFVRDVRIRSAANYRSRMVSALQRAWQARDYEKVIKLLQDHPYVLPRGKMALLRAYCCQALGDSRGAAVFFADARKFEPENADLAHASIQEGTPGAASANGAPTDWPALAQLLKL